ncbi:MAG: alkaline phosphatase family protein [Bacillota bacterium]
MLRRRLACVLFICFLFLSGRATGTEPEVKKGQAPTPPPVTRHVFVVVIEGLQAQVLESGRVPNLEGLAAAGVSVPSVTGVQPSTLAAATASVLTGTDPSRHGCLHGGETLRVPSLPLLMEKQGIVTAFFDASRSLSGLSRGVSLRYSGPARDPDALEAFLKVLRERRPYFSVLVLRGPGSSHFQKGPQSGRYLEAVAQADVLIGRLLQYLYQEALFEQSTFVIAGTGENPALILKGLAFKSGVRLPPAGLTDAGRTLAYVTGLKLSAPTGLVLWNALAAGPYHSEEYLLEARVKDLSEAYLHARREINALHRERRLVQEERAAIAREKEVSRRTVSERDARIRALTWRIRALEALSIVLVVIFGAGYIIEYRILKRRFLLF